MESHSTFAALMAPLQKAVADEGYTQPTPIQEKSIPPLLEGRDLLGCAQTGTGKTAAFTLPMLQRLTELNHRAESRKPLALILTPTRELAAQIGDSIKTYGQHLNIRHTTIYGGVGQHPQVKALHRGCHVVVATPGRLEDLIQQGHLRLERVRYFVLDEADRMLDMGFIPAIRRIIAQLPAKRQSLFFSATMPPVVAKLAADLLHDPVRISIAPNQPTVERIEQRMLFVDRENKDSLLIDILGQADVGKTLVFARTKHGADRVVKKLTTKGIHAAAIHGNKSQSHRTSTLHHFRSGTTRVLVATDLAARGIDVDGITHVINYDLPEEPETYVHRIGRTARAGAAGDSISFCASRERDLSRAIERTIGKSIRVDTDHAYHSETARNAQGPEARPEPRGRGFRAPPRPRPEKAGVRLDGSSTLASPSKRRGRRRGTSSFGRRFR